MLYLTLFKIAVWITKFSRYLTTRTYSTHFSWKRFCFSSHLAQTDNIVCWKKKILKTFLLTFFHQLILWEGIFGTGAQLEGEDRELSGPQSFSCLCPFCNVKIFLCFCQAYRNRFKNMLKKYEDIFTSIVKGGYQDNFKPVFFYFFTKRLTRTKTRHALKVHARVENWSICRFSISLFLFC